MTEEELEKATELATEWMEEAMQELWSDYESAVNPEKYKDFGDQYFATVDFIFMRLCSLLYALHVANPTLKEWSDKVAEEKETIKVSDIEAKINAFKSPPSSGDPETGEGH